MLGKLLSVIIPFLNAFNIAGKIFGSTRVIIAGAHEAVVLITQVRLNIPDQPQGKSTA